MRLFATMSAMAAMLATNLAPAAQNEKSAPSPSGADTPRPTMNRALSLKEAVEIALKESPVIRGAEEEVSMALARLGMAKAGARPIVSATSFLTTGSLGSIFTTPAPVMPQNIFAVPRGNFFDQNVMLMYPLYSGGRLPALIRQAKAAGNASSAELEALRSDLALEVKIAYRQTLLAEAMTRVAEQRTQATAERLRIDRAAFEEGRIPKIYVLRDEAENADATQMLVNARRDLDVAFVLLRTVMGVSAGSQITLSDTLRYEPSRVPPNSPPPTASDSSPASGANAPKPMPAALLALAEKQRPELRAALQRLEAAKSGTAATRGAYQPEFAIMAMGDSMRPRGMQPFSGATVGLVVGFPILDGGMRKASVSEARAQQRKARQEYEKVKLDVQRDVQIAWLALLAAEANIKTAGAGVVAAEEDYRVAQARYESGRGVNVEVLDALTALTRARTNHVQALYEYNVAADQLVRAIGER